MPENDAAICSLPRPRRSGAFEVGQKSYVILDRPGSDFPPGPSRCTGRGGLGRSAQGSSRSLGIDLLLCQSSKKPCTSVAPWIPTRCDPLPCAALTRCARRESRPACCRDDAQMSGKRGVRKRRGVSFQGKRHIPFPFSLSFFADDHGQSRGTAPSC